MDLAKMRQEMLELLSHYRVDLAGIDLAIDLAIAYGEDRECEGYERGRLAAFNEIAEG